MCYARYEKLLKNNPSGVAKKYLETFFSPNLAARNPDKLQYFTITHKSY